MFRRKSKSRSTQTKRQAFLRHVEQMLGWDSASRSVRPKPRTLRVESMEERRVLAALIGVDDANNLLAFDSATPGTVTSLAITGLQPTELIAGVDTRPATGQLYALGLVDDGATRTGRIYTINPATAVATQVGGTPWSTTLPDNNFGGFNFNPNVDLIRIINRNGQNFRVSPETGALVGTDTNTSSNGINGVSYTNNDGAAPTTTLYGANYDDDDLVTIGGINGVPSPNTGQVFVVGSTTLFSNDSYGFEITPSGAFATANGELFSVNLNSGAMTPIGPIAGNPIFLGLTASITDSITVGGTAGNDTVVVTATSANSGSYTRNGGPAIPFAGINTFAVIGGGGDDTLTINNPVGGLFAPAGGLIFHGGGQPGDALSILGGAATFGTYNPGPTAADGVITHVGAATQTITFTGLAPVTDTVAEANFAINATAGSETINIVNGPILAGPIQTTQVNSGTNTFELVNFANKTNVDVNGNGGTDTFNLNLTLASPALVDLDIDGNSGQDTVNVLATPTGVTTVYEGVNGNDQITVSNAGSVQGILGPVDFQNALSTSDILVDNSADLVGRMATIAAESITGLAPAVISYDDNDVDDITINFGSGNDTITVAGSVFLSINTMNGGSGDDTFNIAALGNGSTNNYNGEAGDDTFNVTGFPTGEVVAIDGGPHTTGDTLNFDAAGAAITDNGAQYGNGVDFINYVNIENRSITNATSITVLGTAGDDVLEVDATGPNAGTYSLNGGTDVAFTGIVGFGFDGLGGNDTLRITNPVGGLFAPTGGIDYNGGGQAGDRLESIGGAAGTETYFVGTTTPPIGVGPGNNGSGTLRYTGPNTEIRFTGLAPVITTVAAASLTVFATDGANNISVTNGTVAPRLLVAVDAFETIEFNNKTVLILNADDGAAGGDVADAVEVDFTNLPAALTTVTVNGAEGDDTVNVRSRAGAVAVSVNGNAGNDTINLGSAANSLDALVGAAAINVNGDGQLVGDTLNVNDQGDADLNDYTVTSTGVTRTAVGVVTINYATVESLVLNSGGAVNNIDVQSTLATTPVTLNTGAGNDVIDIGSAVNQVSGILGAVTVNGQANDAAPTFSQTVTQDFARTATNPVGDTINYNDQGTAVAQIYGLTATQITRTGVATVTYAAVESIVVNAGTGLDAILVTDTPANSNAFINTTAGGDIVTVIDTGASSNLLVTGDVGANTVNILSTGDLSVSVVDLGAGDDTANVTGNGVTSGVQVNGEAGDDFLNVQANALSAFSANRFEGDDDEDVMLANFAAGTTLNATASLGFHGGNNTAPGRDSVLFNIDPAELLTRNVVMTYGAAPGSLDVAGLGGAFGIEVTTSETMRYDAGDDNDDLVTVVGTVVADLLTAAVVPTDLIAGTLATNSALVFLDGAPYLGAPPADLNAAQPGVGNTGVGGPDILLNNISRGNGLTLDGGDALAGNNRAIAHAATEYDVSTGAGDPDYFGFGAGVILPGFGVGNAYDNLSVSDALVQTLNNFVGGLLVDVNINTATFLQTGPAPNQLAGLVVNGGDEAIVRPIGSVNAFPVNARFEGLAADHFVVAASNNINLRVNGNLPDPAILGPDGLPVGDQLFANGPGSLNIFSDKAVPPNVSLQFSGAAFGLQTSSIERLVAAPGNGTVNLIGDNNDPAAVSNQPDTYVVRGRDTDSSFGGDVDGVNEMTISINQSAPILVFGVQFLKAYGDDLAATFDPLNLNNNDNNVDTLDIRGYADNTFTGWGVDSFFNEGAPVGNDGTQADLIIYHTATGIAAPPDVFGAGTVSENIIVQPTGQDTGEIRSTNQTGDSLIMVVSFVANTDIIFVDDDGVPANGGFGNDALSDNDDLTLRGTDPSTTGTSGNERFDINVTAADGTAANPVITVTDIGSLGTPVLYRVLEYRPTGAAIGSDFEGVDTAGNATIMAINFEPLGGDDVFQVDDPATAAADGTSIVIPLSINMGSGNDRVDLRRVAAAGFAAGLTVEIIGGEGNDTLLGSPLADIIHGNAGDDTIIGAGGVDYEYGEDGNDVFGNVTLVGDGVADDAGDDFAFGGAGFDNFVWEPGDGADTNNGGEDGADIFRFFGSAAANTFTLRSGGTPTHFNALIGATNIDNHGIEDIVVNALGGADTIVVQDLHLTEVVALNLNLGPADGAVDTVTVNGRNLADSLLLSNPAAGTVQIAGLRYNVNVSAAEVADTLAVNGNDGDDRMVVGVGVNGVLALTLNGNDGNDTFDASATLAAAGSISMFGGAGNDSLIGGGDNDAMDGGDGDDSFLGNGGTDSVIGGVGLIGDTILAPGTAGSDTLAVAIVGGELSVTINGVTTLYNSVVGALPTGIERLLIETGDGDDVITVVPLTNVNIVVDAGGPVASDTLNVTVAANARVTQGDVSTSGTVDSTGGGDIDFSNTELLNISSNGPASTLTVRATNDDDTIAAGSVGITAVWINDGTVVRYNSVGNNFTTVVVQGRFGNDNFSITPHAGVALQVDGGDPTASDSAIINGTAGQDTVGVTPTDASTATVQVNAFGAVSLTTIEHLTYSGLGGNDNLTYSTPALHVSALAVTTRDGGELRSIALAGGGLVPFDYQGLGSTGTLAVDSAAAGRDSFLGINGGPLSGLGEFFQVLPTGQVQLFGDPALAVARSIPITTPGIANLQLTGDDGDDTFIVPGNHPFTSLLVDGGNPDDGSDVLNFTGTGAGAVTLDFQLQTVTEVGQGPVAYTGLEIANVDAANANFSALGTTGDDVFDVSPTELNAATIAVTSSLPLLNNLPVVNASAVGTLTINNAAELGDDQLRVRYTSDDENIDVNGATGIISDGGVTQAITFLAIDSVQVFGEEGSDTFNVTPTVGLPIFIDGGDPIGIVGDTIVINGGVTLFIPGPENDEGGFQVAANGLISFDHIEAAIVNGAPCAIVVGTNGDDDITVIARDASTHAGADGVQDFTVSVNAGLEVLYLGTAMLGIDARSGDDDIVVRAPAPNDAAWNVRVDVVGGAPSIGDPAEADRLVLETPLADDVTYSPTGPDTATLSINGGAGGIINMISSLPIGFCPDIDYVSSVGGIEVVQYDGELTAAGLVADTLTINGTSIEDTTVIHAAQIGSGTFRSGRSPLFDFRSFTTVTVNGGTGGFDQVIINGTEGPDAFTSPAADAVALTGGVRVNMTAGGLERVDVNSFGGNDSIVLGLTDATLTKFIFAGDGNDTVNVSTSVDATIFGGDGDDLLVGSPAADTIFGGAGNDNISGLALIDTIYGDEGNDIIIGGTGNDNLFGGDGSDRFIWNNGDNSDIVEGDEGVDVQIVNGAAAGDVFLLRTATGNQARAFFERTNLVPFSIDMGKVEQVDMNTLAGADQITIRDLSTTDVRQVIADVGAQADLDTVSIDGRTVSDVLALTSLANGIVNLAGLPYDVNVANLNSAIDADTLTLNTLEGNDRVTSSDGLNAIFGTTLVAANRLTINGGEGDDQLSGFGQLNGDAGRDVLIGGAFSQTLNGGDDADLIEGGGGDDSLVGGAGEDTFVGGAGNDTVDGGGAFDTILIRGTSGNDTINVFQSSSTTLIHTVNGDTQTDTLAAGTVERTIVDAGDGADLIRARLADALFNQPGQSVQIVVHGGSHEAAGDRLVIVDDGADDLTIYRKSQLNTDGTVTIGPGNTETFEHVFTGIERVDFVDENGNAVNNAANGPQLAVFKHDPFESNDDRFNATHVGANETVNIDPTIDPGPVANPFGDNQNLPGDQDFYRVVADVNGILDFQVYFRQVPTLASGRPGLPNNGNLDIEVLDAAGNVITGFGNNDATSDERVRIPAVAGQTYFLRVFGNGVAINNYNITITNHPPTVPYDLELNDILQVGTVTVGTSVTQFTATIAPINRVQNPANFDLVGKTVEFTSGPNIGRQAVISAFNNITGIFSVTNSGSGLIQAPNVNDNFIIETTDTGRSQFDNTLRDNTPVITFRLDDGIFLHDLPGNALDDNPPDEIIVIPFNTGNLAAPATAGGYRIAIFVEGEPQQQPNTAPQIPIGYARRVRNAADTAFVEGVYTFDFGIDAIGAPLALTNGSHFISAKVEITDPAVQRRFGYGDRSVSLEVVVDTLTPPVSFGDPAISDDGLHANSDSGDPFDPVTLSDNATNDTTPTFFGRAEANSIVRAYLDRTNNGLSADDFLLGQTVASPLDGTNQHPFGEWEITSTLNMNDPTVIATLGVDGIRNIFVTAEDQAGNISPVGALNTLQIFVDTRGPQVTDVFITNVPAFNLFTLKPNNAPQGPTPAVNSLTIRVQDFPARALGFLYEALSNVPPLPPIVLVGDHSGPIAAQVQFVSDPVNPGAIARGSVILTFNSPLPDDRYTLTIGDSVIDPVGNRLDGENRTAEPLGAKDFPTGDGIPGGDFLARFTVDSRPEVATWSQGLVYADINGNLVWDYEGQDNDFTNRDFIYNFGNVTDAYFTGNFAKPAGSGTAPATKGGAVASGYDKVGAYGAFNGTLVYQFALDTNDDGVVDLVSNMPAAYQVNAIPVSGNFDGSAANGEEIGAFDGTFWYLDVNGNNAIDLGERFATDLRGIPVTGDFNGDGATDLATFNNDTNTFFFDLDRSGSVDNTVVFGFTGFTDKPISGDVNLDGVDDIVVWVAGRQGQLPREIGEFHFLVSDNVPAVRGVGTLPSAIFNPFSHAPLGNDFISQFGDEFALPLLANFDPPLDSEAVTDTESPTLTNEVNPLDTNVDGRVTPLDALLVINTLNKGTFLDLDPMIRAVAAFGTQKPDTNADRKITPLDALKVINGLNRQSQGEASNQAFAALAATTDAIFGVDQDDEEEDPLLDLLATDQHGHAASGANRVG